MSQGVYNLERVSVNTKTPYPYLSDPPGLTLDFAHLYHLLLRKSWLILLCIVLSLLAAVAYLMHTPRILADSKETGSETGRKGLGEC
jgi:hypothetical protein